MFDLCSEFLLSLKFGQNLTKHGTSDNRKSVLVAFGIAGVYFKNVNSGTVAIKLVVIAGVFILTSLISFYPLYLHYGFPTYNKSKPQIQKKNV